MEIYGAGLSEIRNPDALKDDDSHEADSLAPHPVLASGLREKTFWKRQVFRVP